MRVAILALSAILIAAPLHAAGLLPSFLGHWTGDGYLKPPRSDSRQKIRCKVEGHEMSDMQISFAGRCATTSGAGGFRLLIASDASGRNFAARASLANREGQVAYAGRAEENTIALVQSEPLIERGRTLTSTLRLTVVDGGDILLENPIVDLADNAVVQELSIRFVRQE